MSGVLSTFPWTTDFLVKDITAIVTEGDYLVGSLSRYRFPPYRAVYRLQAYLEAMAKLEDEVDRSKDTVAERLKGALGRVLPESHLLPTRSNLDRGIKHKVCEVICAYRLVDLLYDLQDPKSPSSYERPSYPKQRFKRFLPTKVK